MNGRDRTPIVNYKFLKKYRFHAKKYGTNKSGLEGIRNVFRIRIRSDQKVPDPNAQVTEKSP